MIQFSNGHRFQFMAASGALAFDGRGWPWECPLRWAGLLDPSLFTIVTKTVTRFPRSGNLRWSHPWSVVKRIGSQGVLNAIGLTNPGIEWWCEEVFPKIPTSTKIVLSLEAVEEEPLAQMIERCPSTGVVGIELNLSCPNTPHADRRETERTLNLCKTAARLTPVPLIAKLSVTHDYAAIVRELDTEKFQAVSINSVPWTVAFPDRKSPLEKYGGGGISGKLAQRWTWRMVEEIGRISRIPVIGPSTWEYEDIGKLFRLGARAVSFGSVFLTKPWAPTRWIRRWTKETTA